MKDPKKVFIAIIALSLLCLYLNLPLSFFHSPISFLGVSIPTKFPLKYGLDLAGGSHLVFEANTKSLSEGERGRVIEGLKENIQRRVNMYGLSETLVQTSRSGDKLRLIVELPGVKNVNEAIGLIGQTAVLDFRQQKEATDAAAGFIPTGLTGADLQSAGIDFDHDTNQPVITLQFTEKGGKKFANITKKNVGKILAIFLDKTPLSFPKVEEPIKGGRAIIRGNFDLKTAKKMAAQLNAGALPVSVKLVEQRTVEATLGKEAVKRSVRAGLVGLFCVMFFMAAYYGKMGLFADLSLVVYGLISFTLYRLIPITLTLPGVAGFILSVGMAVDANILIFERMREELRAGKEQAVAQELAFGRAWDSIRDANICTIITAFVLFNPFEWNFLPMAGMVRGFALTLGLGVIISLFTGIVVTRTLIRVLAGEAHGSNRTRTQDSTG